MSFYSSARQLTRRLSFKKVADDKICCVSYDGDDDETAVTTGLLSILTLAPRKG